MTGQPGGGLARQLDRKRRTMRRPGGAGLILRNGVALINRFDWRAVPGLTQRKRSVFSSEITSFKHWPSILRAFRESSLSIFLTRA
jgi:hypothetical protein